MAEGQQDDSVETYLFIGAIISVVTFALFYYYGYYIAYGWAYFNYGLTYPADYIYKNYNSTVLDYFFFWSNEYTRASSVFFNDYISVVTQYKNPEEYYDFITQKRINDISTFLMISYLPIIFSILSILKILEHKNDNSKSFKQRHSIQTLAEQEADLWPHMKVVIWDNPMNYHKDEGVWASARKPYDYLKERDLLTFSEDEYGQELFEIKTEELMVQLLKDLGREWKNFDDLSVPEREIMAIILPHLNLDASTSYDINKMISHKHTSYKTKNPLKILKKIKFDREVKKVVDATIKKYATTKETMFVIDRHSYVSTVIASALHTSRAASGVLASGTFLWLKKQDRPLWYLLNTVGRKVAHSEASASWCHYQYEKLIERKIYTPMISNAISSFSDYLAVHYSNFIPLSDNSRK
jgi:intracellular multiplication protein IcmP